MTTVSTTEEYITAPKGKIFVRRFLPIGQPVAHLLITHGYGEHSGRYVFMGQFFAENGFLVTSYDLPGHGLTYGRRAHIGTYQEYLDALNLALKYSEEQLDELKSCPLFVFGHSMGGLITARYLEGQVPPNLQAAALTSPYLGCNIPIPKLVLIMAQISGVICPIFAIKSTFSGKDVTQNPEIIQEYDNDPLMVRRTTTGWFRASNKCQDYVLAHADAISVPLFCWAGDTDKLAKPEVTASFMAQVKTKKVFRLVENSYHEVLNEAPYRQAGLEAILAWFKEAISSKEN